jgi:hypothetical protein
MEERMKKAAVVAILLLMSAFGVAQSNDKDSSAKNDPWAGTYKLDTSKSKFHEPAPKDESVQLTTGDGTTIKYTISGTARDGKSFTESFDGKADDNPYPVMLDGQESGKISYHRDSDHQYTAKATMSDGSETAGTVILSQDGKTVTVKSHIKDKNGEYDQTAVYNRQ